MNALLLIPTPIAEDKIYNTTKDVEQAINNTKYFIVERLRTARRFIKAVNNQIVIDELTFFELGDDANKKELGIFIRDNIKLGNIGLMSEAGCPAIADPGSLAVQFCHHNKILVRPLVGPSSIILSLMASGFNGQNFPFHGYLPNKRPELMQKVKEMMTQIYKNRQTQIFIETPYRNRFMIETVLASLNNNDNFCVCVDLDSSNMKIFNYTKADWIQIDLDQFHKKPAIFLLG